MDTLINIIGFLLSQVVFGIIAVTIVIRLGNWIESKADKLGKIAEFLWGKNWRQ